MSRPLSLLLLLLAACRVARQDEGQTVRYFRGAALECTFTVSRSSLVSVTPRGRLTVTARYDARGVLVGAEAALSAGGRATVTVNGGRAKVERSGAAPQEFDVPPGVIVTSAPDWTDAFEICRRRGPGKQEFAGLWIHPEQPAQRLSFRVEKLGSAVLDHAGRKLDLDVLSIRLRGNSAYLAWADAQGRMIKLISLPAKEGGAELVLEGFEASSANLKAP